MSNTPPLDFSLRATSAYSARISRRSESPVFASGIEITATITLRQGDRELEIDARPSDAIALAVRTEAPIFVAEDVIAESAIEFEHEVEDTEEVVGKFRKFLDEVSPEDFGAEG